jgi:PTH1 family peptidyl-tRNA hydrolase
MKLIVGLGNPGMAYSNNRHNIGFMCISRFAKQHKITFDKKQGQARVGLGEVSGQPAVLARPQTYMNASGEAVRYLVNRYKIDMNDLIVIHDDMDLPLGKIRIRQSGRSAGHKGIESIISYLDNPEFIRVRVGIGRPEETGEKDSEVIGFVLNDFTDEETKVIAPVISRVSEALWCLITEGLEPAMNKFNRSPEEKPESKNISPPTP